MNVESLRAYCLSLAGVTESFPFDEDTLVFKVGNKIFALVSLDSPLYVNLKCDPEEAIALRERYSAVTPGYHMNKTHWNSVHIDGTVPSAMLKQWTLHSYNLVLSSLPKKNRQAIMGNV